MEVVMVPILSDNYSYLLVDRGRKVAAVVDPAEPKRMLNAAEEQGVTVTTVLTTHHHWDHAGGNDEIKRLVPGIRIYASKGDGYQIPSATDNVNEGDRVTVEGSTHELEVLSTPCHTKGHICYHSPSAEAVFTGDTLFVGGCGRFFEGDAAQMQSAMSKLALLPAQTKVFCGHEYTVKNLEFCVAVEPDNKDVVQKLAWAKERRSQNLPTIPSTIEDEKAFNCFMRTGEPSVAARVGASDPTEVMHLLREMKNSF